MVPTGDVARDAQLRKIFADIASGPPRQGVMPHEQLDAHVYNVRGLTRLGAPIPPCAADAAPEARALDHHRRSDGQPREPRPRPGSALGRSHRRRARRGHRHLLRAPRAGSMLDTDRRRESGVLGRLLRRDPDRFRDLFLWGIERPAEGPVDPFEGDSPASFMIQHSAAWATPPPWSSLSRSWPSRLLPETPLKPSESSTSTAEQLATVEASPTWVM